MGFFDKMAEKMSKLNMATGGKNPTDALFAGLAGLGLEVREQKGAVVDLGGSYKGREAAMHVDGSNISRGGNAAMMGGVVSEMLGAGGADWLSRRVYYRSHNTLQHKTMLLEWRIQGKGGLPEGISIGRDKDFGQEVAGKVYASASLPVFQDPAARSLLENAKYEEITVKDGMIQAYWGPAMTEYQKIAANPDLFTATTRDVLDLLVKLDSGDDDAM